MNPPSLSDWQIAEVLVEPQELFVLWCVYEGLCKTLDDFRHHYGSEFPAAAIAEKLAYYKMLNWNETTLVLLDRAYDALGEMGEHVHGRKGAVRPIEHAEATPEAWSYAYDGLKLDISSWMSDGGVFGPDDDEGNSHFWLDEFDRIALGRWADDGGQNGDLTDFEILASASRTPVRFRSDDAGQFRNRPRHGRRREGGS
jgi:hypothetical protein